MNFWIAFLYLSSHIDSSWCSNELRGNSLAQYWHSAGNSETAFSTARLRDADVLLISILQLGQVAISSRSLASAKTWVKQPAHIKCPFVHCEHFYILTLTKGTFFVTKKENIQHNCSVLSWVIMQFFLIFTHLFCRFKY